MRLAKEVADDAVILINLSVRGDKDVQSVVEAPSMSRLASHIRRPARARENPGSSTYVTAGDPDPPRTRRAVLEALDRAGADVLEVGVPFSDPLADGPVIPAREPNVRSRAHDAERSPRSARRDARDPRVRRS
jgi:hypothetical protein